MDGYELAAVVGAAAWLPQIGRWIYLAFRKPKVRLIVNPVPEVGYTSYGPILNVNCAFAVSGTDAVVERMTATLVHEHGQRIELTWNSLNETFSQVRGASGETAQVTKNQPAIALKLSTLVLVEKLVGFHSTPLAEEYRTLLIAAVAKDSHLRKTSASYPAAMLQSTEQAALEQVFESRFPWQEGNYSVALRVHMVDVQHPAEVTYGFTLTQEDIERLTANIAEVRRYLRELVAPPAPAQKKDYQWNWSYPRLKAR